MSKLTPKNSQKKNPLRKRMKGKGLSAKKKLSRACLTEHRIREAKTFNRRLALREELIKKIREKQNEKLTKKEDEKS